MISKVNHAYLNRHRDTIHNYIRPVTGIREELKDKGLTPRNYDRCYRVYLNKVQQHASEVTQRNIVQEKEKTRSTPKLYRNHKYDKVESKTHKFMQLSSNDVRSTLKKPEKIVKENKLPSNPGGNKSFGKTPKYLNKYMQKARSEKLLLEQKREEDLNCPIGYKAMPEAERVKTVSDLKAALKEVEFNLGKGPLEPASLTAKKYKRQLLDKQEELLKLLYTFNKKVVYVRK